MKKIKVGIFGLWRGDSFIDVLRHFDNTEVTSLCDGDAQKLSASAGKCPGAKTFSDFDEFIASGIDCVFLCNFFNEHAPYAIKAMERGVHVFSECTSGATLAECVKLCETVEKTGCEYMLAENYQFTAPMLEIARLCRGGSFGDILYAEGEYNHTGTRETLQSLTPGKYHWRAWLPRTYYVTHALGPLMYATRQLPVTVSAVAVKSKVLAEYDDFRHNTDAFAMMSCKTDGGALFRFTGCAAMASPSGYRVVGEYGSAETGRTLGSGVNVFYHPWTTPEGVKQNDIYTPDFPVDSAEASAAGHGGGDYFTVRNFINRLCGGEEPFFNVYRGCAMSAVAIYGWRSCLENGKTYAIPDFRDAAAREAIRNDTLSPFPDKDGKADIPCRT